VITLRFHGKWWGRGSRRIRARQGSDRGTAVVEFALIAPVFNVSFAGIVDIGLAIYTRILLESAVEAGASYALLPTSIGKVNATNGTTLGSSIASVVVGGIGTGFLGAPNASVVVNNGPTADSTGGATPTTGGTASNANNYFCPTGSPGGWTWGSAVAAGSSCAGGGNAGQFIAITASYSYTPFLPVYSSMSSGTMSVSTLVQAQ
jgi:Flp pilus assembly protein TadG